MGLGFYVLLAPKSVKHDYYELMMLPAAAAWAAIGFQALGRQARQWGMRPRLAGAVGVVLLATTAIVQSPWVSGADSGRTLDLCWPPRAPKSSVPSADALSSDR